MLGKLSKKYGEYQKINSVLIVVREELIYESNMLQMNLILIGRV
jgi:hypothetical protein